MNVVKCSRIKRYDDLAWRWRLAHRRKMRVTAAQLYNAYVIT